MSHTYTIFTPDPAVYPELVAIWAAAVKATHHFLQEADFLLYQQLLEDGLLHQVQLTCVCDAQGNIAGFSGCSGDELEMLFVHPRLHGQGIGGLLLRHAISTMHIRQVAVNEANISALDFYRHYGFTIQRRSATDGMGKPYPLLHLSL